MDTFAGSHNKKIILRPLHLTTLTLLLHTLPPHFTTPHFSTPHFTTVPFPKGNRVPSGEPTSPRKCVYKSNTHTHTFPAQRNAHGVPSPPQTQRACACACACVRLCVCISWRKKVGEKTPFGRCFRAAYHQPTYLEKDLSHFFTQLTDTFCLNSFSTYHQPTSPRHIIFSF